MTRVGIDVGGTFTDLVAVDVETGALRSLKVLTTPEAPAHGVLAGLAALAPGPGAAIAHGTTIVTNAVVEGKGARTALVTTRGFRDVLEIGRQNRLDLYRLDVPPRAAPLVPRDRRLEVTERVAGDGRVVAALAEAEVPALIAALREAGAEAVAVALLHAYAFPGHEARLAARLREAFPYVSVSHEINAEFREYERAATTVLNAAVMPVADRYLADLERSLRGAGFTGSLHLLQSSGAMMSAEAARRRPLAMAVSGPAGGVAATGFLVRQLGLKHAIAFDMGGTTTDVCLVADGRAAALRERRLGGHPVRLPSVGVESIGAGGGSLVRVDPTGALKVGPESAGARPGPASYGLGGTVPAVTDAHLVAGTLRPDALLGGEIRVDRARAEAALAPVARALGLGLAETAAGVLEVANAAMMRAIRLISVQRGFDLREFTLVAYGGAGPLHGGRLAQELGMPRVVIPAYAGVFSALGCVTTEVAYDHVQTFRAPLAGLDPAVLAAEFERLAQVVRAPLLADGHPPGTVRLEPRIDVRYVGQNYELEVPWTGDVAALRQAFQALHRRLYAYATGEAMECVNLRVRAAVAGEAPVLGTWVESGTGFPHAEQRAFFPETGEIALPVYRRADLVPEQPVKGPALVEDPWATALVYPGQTGVLDRHGNLEIRGQALQSDQFAPRARSGRRRPSMPAAEP
jgi:N-methylhydantoinase A